MEKIAMHISDIEKWLKQLDELKIKSIRDLNDIRNFHATSMLLFSIFNSAISIGEEVVSIKRLGFPRSYKDIFKILKKENIIDKKLTESMFELIKYRNLLAHEYWSFDEKDIWTALKLLDKVNLYTKKILVCIKPSKK